MYKEGSPAECDFEICCRGDSKLIDNGTRLAGKWGDYNCDLPHQTLKSMFDFISDNQSTLKTDFITWTGDNSPHNTWENTQEEVAMYVANITATLKESLGTDSTIEIFPALGNHDVWPINTEDLTTPNSNWDINQIKESWVGQNWLSEEEIEQFGKFGYYSKKLRQGGRVLALNT